MNTPEEIVKALEDIAGIIADAMTGNYVAGLPLALDLLNEVRKALPPLNASSLDPEDRAAADKESADREAEKFKGQP